MRARQGVEKFRANTTFNDMKRTIKIAILGTASLMLVACAQPDGSGGKDLSQSSDGSKRGDAWLGNASSFPAQR